MLVSYTVLGCCRYANQTRHPFCPGLGYSLEGVPVPDPVPPVEDDDLCSVGGDVHPRELTNHRQGGVGQPIRDLAEDSAPAIAAVSHSRSWGSARKLKNQEGNKERKFTSLNLLGK